MRTRRNTLILLAGVALALAAFWWPRAAASDETQPVGTGPTPVAPMPTAAPVFEPPADPAPVPTPQAPEVSSAAPTTQVPEVQTPTPAPDPATAPASESTPQSPAVPAPEPIPEPSAEPSPQTPAVPTPEPAPSPTGESTPSPADGAPACPITSTGAICPENPNCVVTSLGVTCAPKCAITSAGLVCPGDPTCVVTSVGVSCASNCSTITEDGLRCPRGEVLPNPPVSRGPKRKAAPPVQVESERTVSRTITPHVQRTSARGLPFTGAPMAPWLGLGLALLAGGALLRRWTSTAALELADGDAPLAVMPGPPPRARRLPAMRALVVAALALLACGMLLVRRTRG
jgi:hypothetical protein